MTSEWIHLHSFSEGDMKKEKIPSDIAIESHNFSKDNIKLEDNSSDIAIEYKISWPSNDILTLINTLKACVPENDRSPYTVMLRKIQWDNIAFDNYSGEDCRKTWEAILKRIRKHRLLNEVLNDAEQWVEKPWTQFNSRKSARHPDLPKKPLSPYLAFSQEHYHLRKKCASMQEYQNKLKAMFNEISAEEKERYTLNYKIEKEEYDRKMRVFKLQNPNYFKPKVSKSKFDNEFAFKNYVQAQLREISLNDSKPLEELVQTYKEQWSDLPDLEKIKWFKLSKEKTVKNVEKEMETKVKKLRKTSVYAMFTKKVFEEGKIAGVPFKERMAYVSKLYKALTPEELKELKSEHASQSEAILNGVDAIKKLKRSRKKILVSTKIEDSQADEPPPKKMSIDEIDNETPQNNSMKMEIAEENNVSLANTNDIGHKKMFPGEPEAPPENAYSVFVEEKRSKKQYSDEKLLKKWNKLEKIQRKEYKQKLKEKKAEYEASLNAFMSSLSKKDLKKYVALKKT